MKKEEYLSLSNEEKIDFLNNYLGRTKECKEENDFVWAFATSHSYHKYDKDDKRYVALSDDEIEIQKQSEGEKNKNKRDSQKQTDQFTDEEVKSLKKLIKASDNLLDLSDDYKLGQYLKFSKNRYEVMHDLSTQEKSSKCFRVSKELMEQVDVLKEQYKVSDTDIVNYALYLLVNSL